MFDLREGILAMFDNYLPLIHLSFFFDTRARLSSGNRVLFANRLSTMIDGHAG